MKDDSKKDKSERRNRKNKSDGFNSLNAGAPGNDLVCMIGFIFAKPVSFYQPLIKFLVDGLVNLLGQVGFLNKKKISVGVRWSKEGEEPSNIFFDISQFDSGPEDSSESLDDGVEAGKINKSQEDISAADLLRGDDNDIAT